MQETKENFDVDLSHPAQEDDDFIPLKDAKSIAMLLVDWHNKSMAMVTQMAQVPDGQEIEVSDAEGKPIKMILTGQVREAFLAGITCVSHIFGNIPIAVEYAKDDPAGQ